MDSYKVILADYAKNQLNNYISYIQLTLMNSQAAENVLDDAADTIRKLEKLAGSLRLCENSKLHKLGYHKIHFQNHSYVMIYKVVGDEVHIDGIYHELQDYENIFSNIIK